MRFKSPLRPAAAVFLLGVLSLARAQDAVSMKLDLVAWGDDITGLSLKSSGKGVPLTAKAFTYSKPVSYAGPALLEIHQDGSVNPEAAKAGQQNAAPLSPELKARREKDPTIVALAKLPSGSKRATVLIAPAQGGTYQTFVIDDDPSKLPLGKLRVHNYAPIRVAIRCDGKQPVAMKTKDSFVADPKDGQVVYELAYEKEGAWKIQENNLIAVGSDEQVQLIVLKSEADFFRSSDGSQSGFMQSVTLRRPGKDAPEPAAAPAEEEP